MNNKFKEFVNNGYCYVHTPSILIPSIIYCQWGIYCSRTVIEMKI